MFLIFKAVYEKLNISLKVRALSKNIFFENRNVNFSCVKETKLRARRSA